MAKRRPSTVMPRLRFTAFLDSPGWRHEPLSTFVSSLDAGVSVNAGDRPAAPAEIGVLKTSCVTNGVFELSENKVVLEPEEQGRVVECVRGGTIIISRMNTIALVGANAYVENDATNIFLPDRLWAAKPAPDANMRFVAFILGSDLGRGALSELAAGSSGSMKNIAKSAVLNLLIFAPGPDEQKKIADCLTSLDEVIAAQGRKVEALKAHKRGLMQQLFPREGETRPRLRFPEFRNAQGWKSATVKTLITTITPPRKIPTSGYGAEGLLPIIDQSPDPICGWTNDLEAKVDARCPLIVFGDHTCVLKLVEHDFAQGADGIKIISALAHVDIHFLYFALQADPVSSASYRRHFSLLQEKHIAFPEELKEQQRIADCLSSLDAEITAESTQLAALKTHKQGLMQQLFPAPEAASA